MSFYSKSWPLIMPPGLRTLCGTTLQPYFTAAPNFIRTSTPKVRSLG